jgi:syntaxin 16
MASRDLTGAFMERRSAFLRKRSANHDSNERDDSAYKKLTAGGTSHDLMLAEEGGVEMEAFNGKPSWVTDVDQVEQCLVDLRAQMEDLHKMHASRVGSVFGKDLEDMEGRIESRTREITDQFRVAERILQKVGVATRRAGGEEATVGANVQRSLAKRLQELSVNFRQSQRKYLAEVRTQKSGGLVPGADSRFGIDLHTESSGEFFTTQQLAVVDDLTEAVQSRDTEIVKIAQSIEELGTIFKELAVLVIDQGTILDRIDYNMEAVVDHTKTGIKQLEKAEKHQKNARPLRCIICLSSLIFVLLVILVLKHRPRRGWF